MAGKQSNVDIKEESIDTSYQDVDIKPNLHEILPEGTDIEIKRDPNSKILNGVPFYPETEDISFLQPGNSEDTENGINDIGAVSSSSESLVEGKVGEHQLTVPCSVNLVKIQQSSKKIVLKNHDGTGYYTLTREDDSLTYHIEETKIPSMEGTDLKVKIKKDPNSKIFSVEPFEEISTLQPIKSEDTESGSSDIDTVSCSFESLVEGKVGENQLTVPCSVNLVKIQQSSKKIVLKNHDGSGFYTLTREDDSFTYHFEETKVPSTKDIQDTNARDIYNIKEEDKDIGEVCIKEEVLSSQLRDGGVQGREESSFEESEPERIDAFQNESEQEDDNDTDDIETQDGQSSSTNKEKPFTCYYCTKQFCTNFKLKRHLKKHPKEYSCNHCSKRFKSSYRCFNHKKLYIECSECHQGFCEPSVFRCHNAMKKCSVCQEKFSQTCLLDKHMKESHPKEREYDCPTCGKGYIQAGSLDSHMVVHLEQKCLVCNMIFSQNSLFKDHMKTHAGNMICPECGECYFTLKDLVSHMKIIHSSEYRRHCFNNTDDNDTVNSQTLSSSENSQSTESKNEGKPYTCKYCTKQFRTNSKFKRHLKKHAKPYSCEYCSKRFKSKTSCSDHKKLYFECFECHKGFCDPSVFLCHKSLKKCSVCDEIFSRTCLLEQHMKRSHPKERQHNCPTCGKGFIHAYSIDTHMAAHLEQKCPVCSMIFARNSLLEKHMKTHAGNMICPECGMSFYTLKDLLRHKKKIHFSEYHHCSKCERNYTNARALSKHRKLHSKEKCFKCSECDKAFARRQSLNDHMKIHTGKHFTECPECKKSIAANNLQRHMKTHLGIKKFPCPQCKMMFVTKVGLTRHIRTHTGEKPFYCTICNKKFSSVDHMKKHSNVRPFLCTKCGKSFKKKACLNVHRKIHTGEKPHKCPVCDRRYLHRDKLVIHIRTHTGEKPYPCTVCNKRFNTPASLRCHIRIHTGEKPFQCPECDMKFSSSNAQKAHMRTHTGERPYLCTQCDKRFVMKGHLDVHMRIHTGELPYLCPHCGKRFRIKAHLSAHEKRIHSQEKE